MSAASALARRTVALLLVLCRGEAALSPAVVGVPGEGAQLPEAPVVHSRDGFLAVTLVLSPLWLDGPNISLETRAFNGSVPGPTLAVRPGDKVSILYVNGLSAPTGPEVHNSFHHPNNTNLHLHGLHVSPQKPSDDVLGVLLQAGESFQYEYELPTDHSPGTYWVHPHRHGSAVMQSGAGAAGAFLVLDPPGFLSPQLAALRDRTLVLQAFPRIQLQKSATMSQDTLFHVDRWNWGAELWLVNGAPTPLISMRPGEWQRLRLVAAGVSTWLYLDFGSCDVALLAKDGVYISDFPRFVRLVSLPQGGRSDLVVRCPAGADHTVRSVKVSPEVKASRSFIGEVFRLRVEGPPLQGLAGQDQLEPWVPSSRPRYLQDTRLQEQPQCSCQTSLGLGGNTRWMEGHLWSGPQSYVHISPRNAVVERRLQGLEKHPYHAHTYPFQLQATPQGHDPFFKAGDWHDTYFNAYDSDAVVRFRTVDYSGPQVVHCHNPVHSDQGMIAVEMVVKGEGLGHCGCDVLSLERSPNTLLSEGEFDGGLGSAAAVLFGAVLLVAAAVGVRMASVCRSGELDRPYVSLA